jgi:hypothetical protein
VVCFWQYLGRFELMCEQWWDENGFKISCDEITGGFDLLFHTPCIDLSLLLLFCFWDRSCYLGQDCLELVILLLLSLQCWDSRCMPPCPENFFVLKTKVHIVITFRLHTCIHPECHLCTCFPTSKPWHRALVGPYHAVIIALTSVHICLTS